MKIKIIENYPNYAVTTDGDIYNLCTGKKLKPIKRNGYLEVGLYAEKKEKIFKIHRLVANAFLPNKKALPCVNHKDENKENNNVDNLEWCTYLYNNTYGNSKPINNLKNGAPKLRKKVYMFSRNGSFIAEFCSVRDAGRRTGINQSNITKCCNGKVKSAGGYYWSYLLEVKGQDRRKEKLKEQYKGYADLFGL